MAAGSNSLHANDDERSEATNISTIRNLLRYLHQNAWFIQILVNPNWLFNCCLNQQD